MMRCLSGIYLLLLCMVLARSTPLAAAPLANDLQEERWYIVTVDGKKIGHQHSSTKTIANTVRQTEVLDIVIERGSEKAGLYSETVTEETLGGLPLSFAVRFRASEQETLTSATIRADRSIEIIETVNGQQHSPRRLQLDKDALFPYGQIQKLRASGLKLGSKVRFVAFDPTVMLSFPVETKVLASERSSTIAGEKNLLRVEQTMFLPQTELPSSALVDQDFNLYQLETAMGGLKMRMQLSTRAQALAANESSTFFLEQFAKSPRALSANDEAGGIRYHIRLKTPTTTLPPQTDEQQVKRTAEGFELTICERCGASPEAQKTAATLAIARKSTAWLQSDDPALHKAALAQTIGKRTALDKMQALESFVAAHINESNLSTAYASAKEAFDSRTGDCTENALLLAALGRAAGIPTRVIGGLAYAPDYLGSKDMFIPHAWMQAFIDGRWRSFDSALGGFDAGHIALAVTDGDPSAGFVGATLLGNLVIDVAAPISNGKSP